MTTLIKQLTEWFDNLDFDRSDEAIRHREYDELMRIISRAPAQSEGGNDETVGEWTTRVQGWPPSDQDYKEQMEEREEAEIGPFRAPAPQPAPAADDFNPANEC